MTVNKVTQYVSIKAESITNQAEDIDEVLKVIEKINALPRGTDLTIKHEQQVKDARKAYEDLKDDQKVMISIEIINILIQAEANLELRMANTIDITDKAVIILEYVSRVYNGKPFEPSFTVKIDNEYLKKDEDFKASITNNTNVGTATVTITGDGDYKGTAKATFRINPKPAKLKKVKPGKKSMKVIWYKQSAQTSGYHIMYSLKKNFKKGKKYTKTVTVKNPKAKSKVIKKLKAKKKYYVRIRTFKKVGKTTYVSTWSRTIKTKKIKK